MKNIAVHIKENMWTKKKAIVVIDAEEQDISQHRVTRRHILKDINWINMVTTSSTGWNSGASTIQVTNVTDTGFTVIWISQTSEEGYINFAYFKNRYVAVYDFENAKTCTCTISEDYDIFKIKYIHYIVSK